MDVLVVGGRPGRLPLGILVVNITGSFALGVLTGLGAGLVGTDLAWVLGVGLLGGYTTFSTVSAESVLLMRAGETRRGWMNALVTLGLGVAAAAAGLLRRAASSRPVSRGIPARISAILRIAAWDTETSIHSRIRRREVSATHDPAISPGRPTCTTVKATVFNLAVLSLKNRALIALVTIVAAIFGTLALTSLKQELIPSIEFPQLVVVSTYPGASPEVVSNDVSVPIETAIQGVPGLESTSATSTTNASIIQASFTYGTDLATAEQKINQAINRIKATLPEGVEPNVISASIDDFPVIQLAVTGYDDEETIQAQLEASVIPEIEDVAGVNAAAIVGGVGQRVTITPDQAALAAAGYTQQAIRDALDQNGVLFPGGEITEDGQTLTVQTGSKITSVDEIAALPLVPSTREQLQAGTLTIADVATVEQNQDPVTTISRVDGKPALTIAVTKLPAANTVDVSTGVLAVLPDLEDSIGGAEFTVVFDQAPYIQQSIEALAQEGLLGLFFAVIVILIFLLSVRATLVTAISIPTSVLITFIGIQAFGYSLNILTLGALTIAIGRVVDDSIVVIENIKRHYVGDAEKMPSILRAVREVASAVTASTVTTVAVFLPIAFVGDVTGELFRPFALTVTIAMTASLFVALTIVPVLAYWFLRPGKPLLDAAGNQVDPEAPEAPPSRLQKAYLPILGWTLRHSWITIGLAVRGAAGNRGARAAHEDELPRRLGSEHVHHDAGHRCGPQPRGRGCRVRRGRGDPARHRGHRDRPGVDRLERVCAARRVLGRRKRHHLLDHDRSRRRPGRPARRGPGRRRPSSTTPARSPSPAAVEASARATSRSMSPRPTQRPCRRRRTTSSPLSPAPTAWARSRATSRHPSPTSPWSSTPTRPRRSGCRRSRSERSCPTRCSLSRSARSRSTTRRSRCTSRLRRFP